MRGKKIILAYVEKGLKEYPIIQLDINMNKVKSGVADTCINQLKWQQEINIIRQYTFNFEVFYKKFFVIKKFIGKYKSCCKICLHAMAEIKTWKETIL